MASKPPIPERFSSLVPSSSREDVDRLTKRLASAMSQVSNTSSTNDFIDAKIDSISANLALNGKFKDFLKGAKKENALTDREYQDATRDIEADTSQQERELMSLKRQKKSIADIDENLAQYSTVDAAYSSILMAKIASASGKQKKRKRFDQSAYAKGVLSFYGAVRHTDSESVEKYCHLTGWLPEIMVKCVHLVPKSLESDGLAYLFGVRESVLSEPRNGTFALSNFD
jgi:hypothetical protein